MIAATLGFVAQLWGFAMYESGTLDEDDPRGLVATVCTHLLLPLG